MSIIMIWKCESCGEVFDNQSGANTHLEANIDCAVDEIYIKEGCNGKPKKIALQSPDNSMWVITINDDGSLNTAKL